MLSPKAVKEHLQKYLDFVHEKLGRQFIVNDMDLYLLCIKCMEVWILNCYDNYRLSSACNLFILQDNIYKEYLGLSQEQDKLAFTSRHLLEVLPHISDDGAMKNLERNKDVHYLELVAKLRFGLSVAADKLYTYYWFNENIQDLNHYETEALQEMFATVKKICHDQGVKTEPSHFLVKQIVRQYGFPCLENLCQQKMFKDWIMPAGFSSKRVSGIILV